MSQALVELEERMEQQQRDAMDELRAESEQLIREFEDVVAGVREEKNDLEVELQVLIIIIILGRYLRDDPYMLSSGRFICSTDNDNPWAHDYNHCHPT